MSANFYTVNSDRNKPWNNIPLLPINEKLHRIPEIWERLVDAKTALGKLQGRSIAIPNQGILINSISLQEAKASNEIENIFTTDDELYKAFSESNSDDENKKGTAKEVLRYREALWSGYYYMNKKPGFTTDYFIQMFREIKQTKDSFRPPFVETVIKKGGSGSIAGQIIFTPPRGKGVLEKLMKNLVDFVNDDKHRIDPLIKMAIAHYQFEAIHPFRDGNGRTGRIFNIHFLVKKGLLDLPILYLSRYINDNKEGYYSGLMGVTQRGDWKNWIIYMLRAVEETSHLTYTKINEIIRAKENILEYIRSEKPKLRNPEQLVQAIFTQPFTKVKHLQEAKIYSEVTARDYLNQLAELQVVEKKTFEGHHYYLNTELYRILSE